MKRFFIASLIVLVLAVALVQAIEHDPGYVLLSYGHYTIESSIWIALAAFMLLFFAVYGFFSVIRHSINHSSSFAEWFSGRGYRRSQQLTTRGLIAFIEGNWQHSRKILTRAAAKSETPLLNYLIAARASHALGDDKSVKQFLKKAEQSTAGADIAVGLTQAELQLRSGHFEQSLATLMRVRKNAGKHPYMLYLLKDTYVGLSDWQQVMALLPELKKYQAVEGDELAVLELKACKESLLDIAKGRGDQLQALQNLWQSLPKSSIKNSELVACYARLIVAAGDTEEAEKLIRKQLKKDWNDQLVALYGQLEIAEPDRQLLFAEAWLKERGNDAKLLLCLGRLSLRNALWGKAREYFENSLKLESSSAACAELGRLLAQLGEHEKSNQYFQQGLLLATEALPILPMPEKR